MKELKLGKESRIVKKKVKKMYVDDEKILKL